MKGLGVEPHRLARLLLASPSATPRVSLYLAADPGNAVTTEVRLRNLVREGEAQLTAEKSLDAAARDRARASLDHVASAVAKLAHEPTRGTFVAFTTDDGPEVFHVPCALKTRIVLGTRSFVGPLADLLERADRYAVVLADHRETKILASHLGELEEVQSFADPSEANTGAAGWLGRDQLKANHHRDVVLHRHLQHTADALFLLHKANPFDRVILVGHSPALLRKLEESLHPYLATRVVARESWDGRESWEQLRAHVAAVAERVEADKERALVSRVRDHASGDLRAATGTDATLSALWAGRVSHLLVPEGAGAAGNLCTKCGFLAAALPGGKGEVRCRECGEGTRRVGDLVEEASELAVLTGAKVRVVRHAKAELESLGGFAALLRYA